MLIRFKYKYRLLLLIFLMNCTPQASGPGKREPVPFSRLKTAFEKPDNLYAPFMFWFWDTPLDDAGTRDRMVAMSLTMMQQGFNPGYAHARMCMVDSPDLPRQQWLSDVWFDTFGRILLKAAEHDYYFGYNDEYWWPSGRAAGRVLAKTPDLWAESLYWRVFDIPSGARVNCPESFFTVAALLVDGESVRDLARRREEAAVSARSDSLPLVPHVSARIKSTTLRIIGSDSPFSWTAPDSGKWRVYSFYKYYHPGADGGRLNYLDRRLADKFIRQAHMPYLKHYEKEMGRHLPGVFTDHEGDYGYKLAWSKDLAAHYLQKTQRDIRLWMPLMIDTDDEGSYVTARWDWFETVSDVYADYFKTTSDWLQRHDLYEISNLWEESLMWQAGAVGDFFKVQRAFTLPGTDCLGLSVLKVHDFKETASVCEFESRRFQSEIMGGAGFWGFNPVSLKQAANAVAAWGVSHLVCHGVFSTRTLDYNPWLPDWFDEHPLWPYLHLWTGFVQRNSYINAHGHSAADVLLLNPMDSVWGLCGPGVFDPAYPGRSPAPAIAPLPSDRDIPRSRAELKRSSAWWTPPVMQNWFDERVVEIDSVYSQAIADLTADRIEFLIADRYYLRQMSVEEGVLIRAPFRFTTLVLPPLFILPLDVMGKIVGFAKSGGQVYYLGDLPAGSVEHGLGDVKMSELVQLLTSLPSVKYCPQGISGRIPSHLKFIQGEFSMLQQHRFIDGRHFFWLANNTGIPQSCRLLASGLSGSANIWNSEEGSHHKVPCRKTENGLEMALDFTDYEGYWLLIDPAVDKNSGFIQPFIRETSSIVLDKKWRIRIDPAEQPVMEHPVTPPPELTAGEGSFRTLDRWENWGLDQFSGYMDYFYTVVCSSKGDEVLLDLGDVKHVARIWVNGRDMGQRLWPPHRFDVTEALKNDENRIHVRVGNLINNSYNQPSPSGLLGPVRLVFRRRDKGPVSNP
ncbi:hypothetical protein JW935_06420 [candidate division KSB1 bacterium]|nr:hypothetical protein [candidate division KSB1 bacterium]